MEQMKYYDVTNKETGEVYKRVTANEVRQNIIKKGVNVSGYARTGGMCGKWKIENHVDVDKRAKNSVKGIYPFTEETKMEWEKICKKFRRIKWVKNGGRKLKG